MSAKGVHIRLRAFRSVTFCEMPSVVANGHGQQPVLIAWPPSLHTSSAHGLYGCHVVPSSIFPCACGSIWLAGNRAWLCTTGATAALCPPEPGKNGQRSFGCLRQEGSPTRRTSVIFNYARLAVAHPLRGTMRHALYCSIGPFLGDVRG